jgi:hypothetical protein
MPRISISLLLLFASTASASVVLPQQIDASIKKAVDFLYSKQRDGVWEGDGVGELSPTGKTHGGLTAIATYALLAAGENPNDPKLARAIEFLKELQTTDGYVLGLRAQLWRYLPQTTATKRLIARDTELLVQSIKTAGVARGLFYYPNTPPDEYDHSISQFGVLGLWAGVQSGAEVPAGVWNVMDQAWRAHQSASGGWPYIINSKANPDEARDTLSMTCAGVASLLIISDYKDQDSDIAQDDPNVDAGLKWIGDHFASLYQGGIREAITRYYTLYGIERIGVAGGYKFFGDVDWFATGSDYLLHAQARDGSWGTSADNFGHNDGNIPNTSFAILFFIHGRAPVVINKLSYANAKTNQTFVWNERPRDIANLTRWAGKEVESLLNWHVVNLAAPMRELHDAPILYLAGSKPLTFDDGDEDKLRQFVEGGGMILANADDASRSFTESATKLAAKIFPGYEFRELPADHVLYTGQQFPRAKFKLKPRVLGLSNGVRELFLLLPERDPSRAWQTHQQSSDFFPLGADIIQYATDRKGLENPLPPYFVESDTSIKATRSATVARLEYDGNWNPEPGGWSRLAAIVHNQFNLDLTTEPVQLGKGQLNSALTPVSTETPEELRKAAFKLIPPDQIMATGGDDAKIHALVDQKVKELQAQQASARPAAQSHYQIAHLTGTDKFELTGPEHQEIQNFVSSGGTLIIDAAGGSPSFAESAEKELTAIFGAAAITKATVSPLAMTDPLYRLPAAEIDSIEYRTFAKQRLGRLKDPRICGIVQNGRVVAYYSREDLSAGLVGEQIDGIDGYTPDSATVIMRNIVLSAGASR